MALALAASIVAGPSHAADLGGDCCADLEERITELEATTVRKGNRKVSLSLSGYVAQEITWWNDGGASNIYFHGLGPTQATNVRFNGQAQIAPGWTAGYMLRLQNLEDNPFGRDAATGAAMNQTSDTYSQGLNVQMSYWYLESKDYGKVSVGRMAHAAKSAAMLTDASGTQVFDNYTFLDGFPQFVIRSGGNLSPAALTWGQLAFCYAQALPLGGDCNGLVMNGVRYDTPALAGFTFSASWGENDFWEVAARYAKELGGFKLKLGAGYSEMMDENTTGPSVSPSKHSDVFEAGGYIEHVPTGMFVHADYGLEQNDNTLLTNGKIAPDGQHWYVKSGLRQRWTSLGATVVYCDYGEYIDQTGPAALALGVTSSTFERMGCGIAQEIDSSAMTIYLKYQRYHADVAGPPILQQLDDLSLVSGGALINF